MFPHLSYPAFSLGTSRMIAHNPTVALLRMLLLLLLLLLLEGRRAGAVETHTRRVARQAAGVGPDPEAGARGGQVQDIGAVGGKGRYLRVRVELGAGVAAELWGVVAVLAGARQAGKLMLVRICYVARPTLEAREMGRHCGFAPSTAG